MSRSITWPDLDGHDAAALDTATGLLTPARTRWRCRPLVVNHRARVDVVGRRRRVDLTVERAFGWRHVNLPLLRTDGHRAVCAPVAALDAITEELTWRQPHGVDDVLALLHEQRTFLAAGRGDCGDSPLAARLSGLLERVARL